ncbi:MAG: peroxisomal membrane protein pex14 [Trichoglossum hirsutum]|nr:MAG: peroxisomal membrane protein pex14 [Trichoglossum hirsutum]
MIREDLVVSAVTFLQDPGVSSSPLEKRIGFLQSKSLTQEEIDTALARAGDGSSVFSASGAATPSTPGSSGYGYQGQQVMRQPADTHGGYQGGYWPQQPPPQLPKRDWRDWFIMATVTGGVGYGLYFIAKRYIYPLIAPPTPPQLEQDKKYIDDAFTKAFALLDQLSTDTEALKTSEQTRTERLDSALQEVEAVIGELKTTNQRREEEARRIGEEVRNLKDLIPKAMDAQKESTDGRLRELNTELRSLKTLVGSRMNAVVASRPSPSVGSFMGTNGLTANGNTPTVSSSASASVGGIGSITAGDNQSAAAASPGSGIPSSSGSRKDTTTLFSSGGGRAAIPPWQMSAANKSTGSVNTTETEEAAGNS